MNCTVTTSASSTCGAAAVSSWISSNGDTLAECAAHTTAHMFAAPLAQPAAHPPTRTSRAFVIVRNGNIVGYSDTNGSKATKRAELLGGNIIRVAR